MKSIKLLIKLFEGKNYCEIKIKDSNGKEIITYNIKNNGINLSEKEHSLIGLLPKQYVDLLCFSDGVELFSYDNIDGLKLLGLDEIEKYTNYSKNTYEEDWCDDIIIFAKTIGEDNYLGFRIKEDGYEILDCYFEEIPSDWEVISNDFDDFLCKYISEEGNKFWIC